MKVVGFVLKKIHVLTYFEMLIVPHALHCVDSCIEGILLSYGRILPRLRCSCKKVFGKKNQTPLPWKWARKNRGSHWIFFFLCQGEQTQKVP